MRRGKQPRLPKGLKLLFFVPFTFFTILNLITIAFEGQASKVTKVTKYQNFKFLSHFTFFFLQHTFQLESHHKCFWGASKQDYQGYQGYPNLSFCPIYFLPSSTHLSTWISSQLLLKGQASKVNQIWNIISFCPIYFLLLLLLSNTSFNLKLVITFSFEGQATKVTKYNKTYLVLSPLLSSFFNTSFNFNLITFACLRGATKTKLPRLPK